MRRKLTSAFIDSATAEAGKDRTIYWDDDPRGFGFQITSNEAKSFVLQFRHLGRSYRMAISGNLKLAEARKQARAILGEVAKGRNPLAERRKEAAARTNTLESVAESYFRREGRKLRTMEERQRGLQRLVYPRLGSRQIEDVKRSDLVKLLDKIEDENGAAMADHILAYLSRVFSWQASRSDNFRSPIVRGMRRHNGHARARILSDDEIRKLWAATGTLSGAFGPLVRFLLLTACRRTEARYMKRSEVVGDIWTVPPSRQKANLHHVVPLSKAAKAILDATPVIDNSDLIFTNDGWRPVSPSKLKPQLDKESGVAGWTLHDLRRSARSLLSRAGVNADHAERCLGHVIGGVRGVYDRHAYLDEKRHAFEALAALIKRIIDPQANIVSLRDAQ
jgi:integrase